jgi:Flp pilus assembly protein TadD
MIRSPGSRASARFLIAITLIGAFALAPSAPGLVPDATADGRGSAPPPSSSTPSLPTGTDRPLSPEEKAALDAKRAEDLYASAYRDVQKADAESKEAELVAGSSDAKAAEQAKKKGESATKRYRKAAERFREVTVLAPKNPDAWNMLGYSLRKSGDLEKSFQAYWECLRLKPDHEGAHEYLGEAYLMSGKLEQAKGELEWLKKRGSKEAAVLEAAFARHAKLHPESAAPAATPAGAANPGQVSGGSGK